MKTIWTSLKRHQTLFVFISVLFLFGLITGILFYLQQEASTKENMVLSLTNLFQNNVFPLKNIFYHFLLLFFILFSLFCIIGLPLLVLYIFFEGISIGFILPLFFSIYKINAIGIFSLYFVFIKFFYLFYLFFFFVKACLFLKNYFLSIKKKNYHFLRHFKNLVILLIFILLNDCFVYFVSNRILTLLLG